MLYNRGEVISDQFEHLNMFSFWGNSENRCRGGRVTNSSYGLIFVKIRAKYGRIFSKNTSEIWAKIWAKFMFTTKNSKIKNEQNALFS